MTQRGGQRGLRNFHLWIAVLVGGALCLGDFDRGHASPPRPRPGSRRALEPEDRLPKSVGIPPTIEAPHDALADTPLEQRWSGKACALGVQPAFARRLRALTTPAESMLSLEIWGDREVYRAGDLVYFNARAPRVGYATLFWIGPADDIFIVFQDVRVPGRRDTVIDADAVIVPPVGEERWVAVFTLEPLPFACVTSRHTGLRWLDAAMKRPFAAGHWTVRSVPR